MAGMRVLVTGVDGYIGSVLGPGLLEQGFEVVGLDCGFYREGWLYNDPRPRPLTVTKDVRRILPKDVEGFDAVVHLAELSNDPLSELSENTTYNINHLGSVALARACKEAGVSRFVYTSSCSVYGAAADGGERNEQSAPEPQTAYARCKVLVERDVGALADPDFSPVFLRNATAFGASPRMRFDIVLNNLAGFAWTTREIRMTSDGTPWRPLVHVEDRRSITRYSTWVTMSRTTAFAKSPTSSGKSLTAVPSLLAHRAPTTAAIARRSARSTVTCPSFSAAGRPRTGPGSCGKSSSGCR